MRREKGQGKVLVKDAMYITEGGREANHKAKNESLK